MTQQLPFADIFPHLHPMQKFTQPNYPILADILLEYAQDLAHYRENYLDADRIANALDWIKQHGDLDHKTIKCIIKHFCILDFKSDIKIQTYNKQWIVWLFVIGAFILINQAIENDDINTVKSDIQTCLKNAHDYKRLWGERKGRYKGASKTNAKKAEIKKTVLKITRETNNANPAKSDDEKLIIIKNEFKKTSPNRDFPYKDSSFTRNDDANMFAQAAKQKP